MKISKSWIQIPLIIQYIMFITFNAYSTTAKSGIVTLKGAFKINEQSGMGGFSWKYKIPDSSNNAMFITFNF